MNMSWTAPGALPGRGAEKVAEPHGLPLEDRAELRADALQARAALALTAQLGAAADALPHDITERLRHARMRALDVARLRAAAPAAAGRRVGTHARRGWSVWALRLASVAPLVALVAGLGLIVQAHDDSQIVAAADVDTALLADELPPAAYGDAGFSEFLRKSSE